MVQEYSPASYDIYEGPVVRQNDPVTCALQTLKNCILALGGKPLPLNFTDELQALAELQGGIRFSQVRNAVINHRLPIQISPLEPGMQLMRGWSRDVVDRNADIIQYIIESNDALMLAIGDENDRRLFHAVCVVGYEFKGENRRVQILDSMKGMRFLSIEELSQAIVTNTMGNGEMLLRVHMPGSYIEILEDH